MIKKNIPSLDNGIEIIKNELITIPNKPGIYQMIGENEEYLYIGKAKNLKNRVAFYTQPKRLNSRLTYMVSNTIRMEIVITSSEIIKIPCLSHISRASFIKEASGTITPPAPWIGSIMKAAIVEGS